MDHVGLFHTALDAIAAGDLDALSGCLAGDVIFEFPYAAGSPVLDKGGAFDVIRFVVRTFATRRFSVDRVFDLTDPDDLVVEYSSQFHSPAAGVRYANRYVAILEFRAGRITRWREYADPVAFQRALQAIQEATAMAPDATSAARAASS